MVRQLKDGRRMVETDMCLPPEYVEQYRQGYRCIMCHGGPQPEAFPKECFEPFCDFPMRERQVEVFTRLFAGEATHEQSEEERELGPLEMTDLEWEQAEIDVQKAHEFLWIPPEADL